MHTNAKAPLEHRVHSECTHTTSKMYDLSPNCTNNEYGFEGSDSNREYGNRIIAACLKTAGYTESTHKLNNNYVYNAHNEIQNTLVASAEIIRELLEDKLSAQNHRRNPSKWIWAVPMYVHTDQEPFISESRECCIESDLYKGNLCISMIEPSEFLTLASELRIGEYERKCIDALKEKMVHDVPIDTVYLTLDRDHKKVISHEGRHRCIAAMELGINYVPVYIHSYGSFTQKERQYFTNVGYLQHNVISEGGN